MEIQKELYKLLNIFSFFILIIAYAFIMTQSVINIIYSNNKDEHIVAERLVYEEFSHQVYSNINSKMILDVQFIDNTGTCPTNYEIMNFPIKMESFYDCENIEDDDINKDICQNKITSASLCCSQICCFKKVSGQKEHITCRDKDDSIDKEDKRDQKCFKFSKYNGKFYTYGEEIICVRKSNEAYYDLLLTNQNNNNWNENMIVFDSKGHMFNKNDISNFNYYITNGYQQFAIVKNIFSVDKPGYFEMQSNLKLSMMLNKKKYDEDKIKSKIKQISKINSKKIYDAFEKEKCTYNICYDNNYLKNNIGSIKYLSEIFDNSEEYIFEDFKENQYLRNSEITWYSRNYIGFQNISELKKFKDYFVDDDYKNNPLYKISTTLLPNYTSLVLGGICALICLSLICLSIKDFKNSLDDEKYFYINNFKFLLIFILFLVYLIIYLSNYYFKFEEINIDMEDFYKRVLEKYNYRRKQLYLLIGIIIFAFNVFLELLIQNLKCSFNNKKLGKNGPSINSIMANIKLNGINCSNGHNTKFKLYLNKTFSEYIEKIKKNYSKILEKCPSDECRVFIIDKFFFNGKEIEINKTIKDIGLKNESEIIIEDMQ